MGEILLLFEGVVDQLITVVSESTYFGWALILFLVAIAGSVLSGLLDIALMIAQYGTILLVVLGVLEFVAPGLLAAIVSNIPI